MGKLRFVLPLALVAGTLAVPAALGAGAAEAIKVSGQAKLVAPATVYVTVTYTCLSNAGQSFAGSGGIQLREVGVTAVGFVSFVPVCDDRNHTETVGVPGGPYTPGTGEVFAFVCSYFCASSPPTEVTIR